MWKFALIALLLGISASPLDARESKGSELRRDVERISKEIYPARSAPEDRGSLAAGRSLKKR